jgi:Zn-dependent protease
MAWQPNKDKTNGTNGTGGHGPNGGGSGGDGPNNVYQLPPRRPQPAKEWPVSPSFLGLSAAFVLVGAIMLFMPQYARGAVFPFVVAGWLISLCLHEFGHAIVAFRFGDWTVKDKGYLTLDPAKYTDPFNSILFPLLILALGGIGLPGGAVFIQPNLLRERWHSSLVSAAGPIGNLMVLAVLVAFIHGFSGVLKTSPVLHFSLVFLAFLQLTSIMFNLLPVPGFDGWGIIEPWLPYSVREQAQQIGPLIGFGVLFLFLFVPAVGQAFFGIVYFFMAPLGLSPRDMSIGASLFAFWK